MIYLVIVIGILSFGFIFMETFGGMLDNGFRPIVAFKTIWSDRFRNWTFYNKLNDYNELIEKKGISFILKKEIFDYLDYDEYVFLEIFMKNKIIRLEYSLTYDKLKVTKTDLKNMKIEDRCYGRYMNTHYNQLIQASAFDGDYKKKIEEIVSNYPESAPRKEEMINMLENQLNHVKI